MGVAMCCSMLCCAMLCTMQEGLIEEQQLPEWTMGFSLLLGFLAMLALEVVSHGQGGHASHGGCMVAGRDLSPSLQCTHVMLLTGTSLHPCRTACCYMSVGYTMHPCQAWHSSTLLTCPVLPVHDAHYVYRWHGSQAVNLLTTGWESGCCRLKAVCICKPVCGACLAVGHVIVLYCCRHWCAAQLPPINIL